MASFNNFSVTATGVDQINVNAYDLQAQVVDDGDQHIIADYTNSNAIRYPDVLNTLTDEQRQFILNDMGVAQQIMKWKAGVE